MIAVAVSALVTAFVGAVPTWRLNDEQHWSINEQSSAIAGELQKKPSVLAADGRSITTWDGTTGAKLKDFDGEPVDSWYPYVVLKHSVFQGSEFFVTFESVNLETGKLQKLDFGEGLIDVIRRTWVDERHEFIIGRDITDHEDTLRLADLETGEAVRLAVDSPEEAYLIDSNRMLLMRKDAVPEIWNLTSKRSVGKLTTGSDKPVSIKAIAVDYQRQRVVSIHELKSEKNGDSNIEGNTDTDDEAVASEPTLFVRVWDVSTDNPRILFETPITLSSVTEQFASYDDHSPEAGIKFRSGLSVAASSILVSVSISESSSGTAFYLFDPELKLLDHGYSDQSSGALRSSVRNLAFFGKPSGDLEIWDVVSGQHFTVAQMSSDRGTVKLGIDKMASTLLVTRNNTKVEMWPIPEKGTVHQFEILNAKSVQFTSDDSSIAVWQAGGFLSLWTRAGMPLGQLSGVAGTTPPVVSWNADQCTAVVWTSEGRVLRFVNEWRVLGLLSVGRHGCEPRN